MDERLEMLRAGLQYSSDWKRPLSFFRNYHTLEEVGEYSHQLSFIIIDGFFSSPRLTIIC